MEGAIAVYTVSSQLGFEAILMGHRPQLFGQPFYAGWGLSDDRFEITRRQRALTRTQIFAAAMILYPKWYDPFHDALCDIERAIDTLDATTRCWREDRQGWVASGMSLWKRETQQRFYGRHRRVRFEDTPARGRAADRPSMVWAGKAAGGHADAARVEDGFLRSRGLGARLVAPLSLVSDDLGIYYDPRHPSRLEKWIAARAALRPDQHWRAARLIEALKESGLSKYNLAAAPLPKLPQGKRILVPGQVADDASVRLGANAVRDNLALLGATRQANPDAVILYKPRPDVEAGLRHGAIDTEGLADSIVRDADPIEVLAQVDAVWTMTSLLGFEAVLRGVPVTTLGAPFYAGWGLTRDLGDVPPRRRATPDLEGLVHAVLIDYPRYVDPKSGLPCPVEVVVERLAAGYIPPHGLANRTLSKLQGIFASHNHLWRR